MQEIFQTFLNARKEEMVNPAAMLSEKTLAPMTTIPTQYLKRALELILQENSFQFTGKNYLQTHGTAMGTKMAVAFANIFMG